MLQTPDVSNYNDFSALQNLKSASHKDSREGIRAVAEQFESLFISLMLKSMREANKGFSEGNILSSNESDFYQEMFDSQISVSLAGASTGGMGLADVIERQILANKGMASDDAAPIKAMQLSDYERKEFPRLNPRALEKAVTKVDAALSESAKLGEDIEQSTTLASEKANPQNSVFESPQDFVDALYPIAQKVEERTGISARLMIAQSALETGWGQKPIVKTDGANSFNLFGIKANHGWRGDTADILTTEFHQGVAVKQRDTFRAYASYHDSFNDYADFLRNNPRYESAIEHRSDPVAFAEALQESGYATDPRYAEKIEQIIHSRLSGNALNGASEEFGR